MTPKRILISDEAKVVDLAQSFDPNYMREYLMWTYVWRNDPRNGRGPLPAPVGAHMARGQGLFWEIIDEEEAQVHCFLASTVRRRLEALLEGQES